MDETPQIITWDEVEDPVPDENGQLSLFVFVEESKQAAA